MNQLYLENFYLQLVNREHPARQTPDTARLLASHPDYPDILMEAYAARALHRLLDAIHGFQEIALVSGFRSHKEQIDIWESCEREHGSRYRDQFVAPPGCSEHETGLAIDVAARTKQIDFICPSFPNTGIYEEFRRKAPEFGFIERYPKGKERLTRIACEPWHFRYVGTPHAWIITENHLVLEEYIAL